MNKPLQRNQKPSIASSKIPSVGELCEVLGFRHASLKEIDMFLETTRSFRKLYKSSTDMPADDLLRWNEPAVQTELRSISEKFVAHAANGERFWGVDRAWSSTEVRFPEDAERIIELLMQLFWKQNRYAFNNFQYGHKQPENITYLSRETTTPARDKSLSVKPTTSMAQAPDPARCESFSQDPAGKADVAPTEPNSATTISSAVEHKSRAFLDIFDGPNEEDGGINAALEFLSSTEHSKAIRPTGTAGASNPRKRKKQAIREPRKSHRKRNAPVVFDAMEDAAFEELLKDGHESDEYAPCKEAHHNLDRDSSVEMIIPPTGFPKRSAFDISESIASAGTKAYAAPTAPMTTPKKLRSPSSNSAQPRGSDRQAEDISSLRNIQPGPKQTLTKVPKPASESAKPTAHAQLSAPQPNPPSRIISLKLPVFPKPGKVATVTSDSESDLEHTLPPVGHQPAMRDISESGVPGIAKAQPKFAGAVREETFRSAASLEDPALETARRDAPAAGHMTNVARAAKILPPEVPGPRDDTFPAESSPLSPVSPTLLGRTNTVQETTGTVSEGTREDVHRVAEQPPVYSPSEPAPQASKQIPSSLPPTSSSLKPPTTEQSATKPRPKTQIQIWIITRSPRYTEERWDQGKFNGTSLPAFLAGLSLFTQREHIEKIKLTLSTPTSDTKDTVVKDDEESWELAKRRFAKKLKEANMERRSRGAEAGAEVSTILVEPFYQVGVECEEGEADDEEVDF